jgi:Divergent InlB B-repeat domain
MGEGRGTRRRPARRSLALAMLASAAVALFALLPGTGSAGLPGAPFQYVAQLTGGGAGSLTQVFGPGTGTPAAINCTKAAGPGSPSTGVCTASVPFGTPPQPYIGLQANPQAGSEFTTWTVSPASATILPGSCGQAATCYVQVDTDVTVRANFDANPGLPLTVIKQGPAAQSGTVTSNPAGINCGADCSSAFSLGSNVTLTAAVQAGSNATFGGWGGTVPAACGSNLTCVVPMTAVQAVTATFLVATQQLTVSIAGGGGVSSNVQPGISCSTGNSGTCTASFAQGSQVVLAASPATSYKFNGWSGGGCSGTGTCTVTMSAAQSVAATFGAAPVNATFNSVKITKNGPSNAVRKLQVKVAANEKVKIVIKVLRNGNTLTSKTVNGYTGSGTIALNLKNSIKSGSAKCQVQFTNSIGTKKTQTKNITIPST